MAADATAKDVKTKCKGARDLMGNWTAQGGKGPSKEQAEAAQKERAEKDRWAAIAARLRPRM